VERIFNKDQTRKQLGKISPATLNRQIAKGLITPMKIGARVFFRESEIERFMKRCEAKSRVKQPTA